MGGSFDFVIDYHRGIIRPNTESYFGFNAIWNFITIAPRVSLDLCKPRIITGEVEKRVELNSVTKLVVLNPNIKKVTSDCFE